MTRACETCLSFDRTLDSAHGECRHNPPVVFAAVDPERVASRMTPVTRWPKVWATQWCGQYRERIERKCEGCDRMLVVGAGCRKDKIYCSDACRQKAYRTRKSL
jgi:hypothetical protein